MPGPPPRPLVIGPDLRAELVRVAHSRTASYVRVIRACMVLLCADGVPTAHVARRTGQSERSVRKWKARFAERAEIEALDDAPRSGRPARIRIETRVAVMRLACERPDGGRRPPRFRDIWTHQSLADEVRRQSGIRISKSEVGRILRFHALRPHLVRQWLTTVDRDFDVKAAKICAVYTRTPPGEVVVCVDEKPVQVLARRFPTHMGHDGAVRREFEYVRRGTRAVLAAFDVRTGRVLVEVVPRRTGDALVAFLQRVADAYPGVVVHVVWDNLNTHGDGKTGRWTKFNERNGGRFRFVRTPIHASWLNQVEIWFSILQRRVIKHGDFENGEVLEQRVVGFADLWNAEEAHPFRWTWRSDAPQNAGRPRPARPDRKHAKARC